MHGINGFKNAKIYFSSKRCLHNNYAVFNIFFFFNEIIQNDYVFVNHFVKRTCMRLIEIVNTAF